MELQQLARQLAALEDVELRSRRAAEALGAVPAPQAVELLAGLVREAERRSDPASAALEGALRALYLVLDDEARERLRHAAEEAAALEVLALVTAASATRSFDHDREQWIDREMRARTLGMRKQLARTHDRDLLARLATDQDPAVLRNLLTNPRLTEREVLVAASRRPARAAVLEEIFRARRWSQNRRVRRALSLNPYTPPALAVAAIAQLTAPDLREVIADAHLSPEVRGQARRLLARRLGKPEESIALAPQVLAAPEVPLPLEEDEPLEPDEEARLVAEAAALLAASAGPRD
jgi:hypothetical protein